MLSTYGELHSIADFTRNILTPDLKLLLWFFASKIAFVIRCCLDSVYDKLLKPLIILLNIELTENVANVYLIAFDS